MDARLGASLQTGERVRALVNEWQALKSAVFSMTPKQSLKAQTEMVAHVIDLGHYVADTSGLILDPQLDSYYLMDLVVMQMPILTEGMGQSRAIGSGIAARGEIEHPDRLPMVMDVDCLVRIAEDSHHGNLQAVGNARQNSRTADIFGLQHHPPCLETNPPRC